MRRANLQVTKAVAGTWCGGAGPPHNWQSQNQPTLYSCLHYKNC